jgi:hypothetical protein
VKVLVLLSTVVLLCVGCTTGQNPDPQYHDVVNANPNAKPADMGDDKQPACVVPIEYHGGPVIHGTFNIYYIWYGNWSSNTAVDILTELASNIGGSPYYNINTTYSDTTGQSVDNAVAFGGSVNDAYSKGKTLTDDDVQNIVASAIKGNKLPKDTNGAYFVLASQDVDESSGYCVNYCGFHDSAKVQGADIKYSFVGNPQRCPSSCIPQNTTTSPNDNPGADAMASIVAHELNGMATDPDKDAWYFDSNHFENADQCAWRFGNTVTQSNGSEANVTLGTRNYLLQENWVHDACGRCAISYP